MSFGSMVGIALIVIFLVGMFAIIKESILRPAKYIASKEGSVDNLIVKALAAKEAYDMFTAATSKSKKGAVSKETVIAKR